LLSTLTEHTNSLIFIKKIEDKDINIQGWHKTGDASYWHHTINRAKACVGSDLRIYFDSLFIKGSKSFIINENILFGLRKLEIKIHKCLSKKKNNKCQYV